MEHQVQASDQFLATTKLATNKAICLKTPKNIKGKMYRPGLLLTWVPVWDSAHQVHSRVSNVNFVLCGRGGGGGP